MSEMPLFERIVRYGVAGVLVSVVYALLVIAIVHALPKFGPVGDTAIAFLLAQPVGLLLHGTITYPETGQARIHLPKIGLRFVVTNTMGFAISIGGMALVTSILHDSYLWGIALTWAVIPAMNFVIYLFWVFRTAHHPHTTRPL
jgi:putative flippase GtrA